MRKEKIETNVVIVARQFNPSIFDKLWLVNNNIMTENEFGDNCMFTPTISQVFSTNFNLLVMPDQLQFAPSPNIEDAGELVASKVGAMVSRLPETPYIAAGLNFTCIIDSELKDFAEFNRSLFYKENGPLYDLFSSMDCRFGAYFSKDTLGFRLKLDIKPTMRIVGEANKEYLQLAFNFHRALSTENKANEITEQLKRWDDAASITTEAINNIIAWRE